MHRTRGCELHTHIAFKMVQSPKLQRLKYYRRQTVTDKVSLDADRIVKMRSIELVKLVEGATQEMEDRDRILWPVMHVKI